MFNVFKERCPVCKTELMKGKEYPEERGKKFCSENCRKTYSNKSAQEEQKSKSRGGCCG